MVTVLHMLHKHTRIMCLISAHVCINTCMSHIYICTLDKYLLSGAQQVDGLQAGDGLTPFVDILNNYRKQRGMGGPQPQLWGAGCLGYRDKCRG